MDYKKIDTGVMAVSRDTRKLEKGTENIYETTAILSIRAEQIAQELKAEYEEKVADFQNMNDTLEEIYENREQIEVAKYYESLPKPTLLATWEFLNDKIYFRNPIKEDSSDNF